MNTRSERVPSALFSMRASFSMRSSGKARALKNSCRKLAGARVLLALTQCPHVHQLHAHNSMPIRLACPRATRHAQKRCGIYVLRAQVAKRMRNTRRPVPPLS